MDPNLKKGTLYLIPAPIGECLLSKVIPSYNLGILENLRHFIVEDIRTARRFLKKAIPSYNIDLATFLVFNEHTDRSRLDLFLEPLNNGNDTGLLSEAGLPCIADPGSEIVRMAHQSGVQVVPLSGPSSLFLALMSSGFNGQQFCFHGYLPVEKKSRARKLRELEREMILHDQAQLFIEAPYRNLQLFQSILEICAEETLLCIASDLTLSTEYISMKPVRDWKKITPDIQKRPAVFLLYKE
ncbi:MAG: SAM-dependent methyltransferase [Bacteroidota bacterium]|nr:SAM-dependent methyltransferase [Bacteroidota bacterium]